MANNLFMPLRKLKSTIQLILYKVVTIKVIFSGIPLRPLIYCYEAEVF